jgi:hypothetical protein
MKALVTHEDTKFSGAVADFFGDLLFDERLGELTRVFLSMIRGMLDTVLA